MKKLLLLPILAILMMAAQVATTYNVDVNSSTIVWTGDKVTGKHTGTVILRFAISERISHSPASHEAAQHQHLHQTTVAFFQHFAETAALRHNSTERARQPKELA
mgnify:CR=1 FL=1